MPTYKHKQQAPWHLVRYGPLHVVRHLRHQPHGHHRVVVSVAHRRRQRVILAWLTLGCVVLALIVLAAFAYRPLNGARQDLELAKSIISRDLSDKSLLTTAAGRAQLETDLGTVSTQAAEADQSMQGSAAWRILGAFPVLGTQRKAIVQLSTDLEQAVAYGNGILAALDNLVSTSHGTTVSLTALAALEHSVVVGQRQMAFLDRPAGGLLGPVASARAAFDHEDAKLVRLLSLSARTIAFARPFLGSNGPQSYLIGGMNNAEMRDGGAVLSLDVLIAKNGTFSIAHDATYGDYLLSTPAAVTLPAGTAKVFGSYLPTENWPSVDATADFVTTGRSMQAMWAQATGQTVNGVIGIDVPGVISILNLTGPVHVPGIAQPVSASNAAGILLNTEYRGDSVDDSQNARRDKIAAVVKAAVDQMKKEHVDLDAFANALSHDVQGRHLLVWSDVPNYEAGLQTLDAAGTLTTSAPDRTFHVAVENSSSDKLDYFVTVAVKMAITLDSSGDALVNTTITVANHARPDQPPSYQYGPDGVNAFTPGQYVARIFFWGPRGSYLPGSTRESGLLLTQSHFSLLAGHHNQVTFATVISHAVVDGRLQLRLVPQARLLPDHVTVELRAPGWNVSGPTRTTRAWANTIDLKWDVTH